MNNKFEEISSRFEAVSAKFEVMILWLPLIKGLAKARIYDSEFLHLEPSIHLQHLPTAIEII